MPEAQAVTADTMRQPSASLPNVPLKPAPWDLKGQGWAVVVKLPEGSAARDAFVHSSLAGRGRGNIGLLLFVDYASADCGPYHELLFIPGAFRFADGRRHLSISRIVVSTWDSVVNGRNNWGIPKDRADFEVQYGVDGSREDRIVVRDGERTMAELRLAALPVPALPVFGNIVPARQRTLAQRFEGHDYFYTPSSRGWGRPGKLLSWRFDADLFPDLAGTKVLGAVKITSFNLTFPVSDKLPAP